MTHETTRQLQILKSARAAGGYGHKASNQYTAGIPDLHVIIPGYAPVDIEVKDLKEVGAKFRRKVDTTPLQKDTMDNMNRVIRLLSPQAAAAFVMVTYQRGRNIFVAYLPADATHVTEETPCVTFSNLAHLWPRILNQMGVPHI